MRGCFSNRHLAATAATVCLLSEPARGFSVLATDDAPPVNFQAGMQQPGILQPAEPDSLSIGHRRFTEACACRPFVADFVQWLIPER
jgi:hypothetical protein